MPSLEVHVPISPTASFITMLHYFAASLAQVAGRFTSVNIVVTVGGDCEAFNLGAENPQLGRYPIEWRWIPRETYQQHNYFATGAARWAVPFQADYVLMADADVLFVRDFSDLVGALSFPSGIGGVMATFPPFMARGRGNIDGEEWPQLFKRAGVPQLPFDTPHPGFKIYYGTEEGIELGPKYYNFGFVMGTRCAMNKIRSSFQSDYEIAHEYMASDLAAQVGLTLSMARHQLRANAFPVRYNFWASRKYVGAYPADFRDLRVLHYLVDDAIRKHVDTADYRSVERWIRANSASTDPLMRTLVAAFSRIRDVVSEDHSLHE